MKSKANRRTLRTIIQFILGGGLTTLIATIVNGLSPLLTGFVLAAGTLIVTWVHNYAEDHEIISTIFPSPLDKNMK